MKLHDNVCLPALFELQLVNGSYLTCGQKFASAYIFLCARNFRKKSKSGRKTYIRTYEEMDELLLQLPEL